MLAEIKKLRNTHRCTDDKLQYKQVSALMINCNTNRCTDDSCQIKEISR